MKKTVKLNKINIVKLLKLNVFERPSIILFTLTIFVVFNLLLSSISLRLDLSKGQAYTLSPSTKKILKNLNDIVNIKFFVSSDLPTRLLPLKTEVIDLLNEYKKQGYGKTIVKTIDPKKDEQAASDAKQAGIPELQFSQLEKDKYAVSTAYFGISLNYGDKKDVIPHATETNNLEYNLTSIIYKLTRNELIKIGLIGLNNAQADPISFFKKIISQQFNYQSVLLNENIKNIDPKIKALILFDDKTKYSDKQISLIKNYLAKGGGAIFFIDGVSVEDNLSAAPADFNLFSLTGDYGININKNLVLSTSAELVNFGNETVQFLTPYPFWLKTNSFNSKSSYFANVNQLTFPWTSSIILTKKKNIKVTELVKTSAKSWQQKDSFILNPQAIPNPQSKDLKQFLVAAEAQEKNTRIVVIPDSRFIQDRYLNQGSGNIEFVLNLLNDLVSQGALAGIRSRAVSFYPLPDLSDSQKDIFKYTNILLLPIIFGIYGGIRLIQRK